MTRAPLPRPVVLLGLAGVLPQAACLALVLSGESQSWSGLAAGAFYAALILSFLGGLWWMAALQAGRSEPWFYALAVGPSLAAWAALLPWVAGWTWPGPSLVALGLMLLASPLVDRAMAQRIALAPGWLRLRVAMATGLGTLTLALALPWH